MGFEGYLLWDDAVYVYSVAGVDFDFLLSVYRAVVADVEIWKLMNGEL